MPCFVIRDGDEVEVEQSALKKGDIFRLVDEPRLLMAVKPTDWRKALSDGGVKWHMYYLVKPRKQ